MKFNVGCGNDIRKGWINLDITNSEGVDTVHDLNKYPYPFKDNTFEKINAEFILEHLDKPKLFIDELYRISKNRGKIHIKTEHFSSCASWGDITHVRPFAFSSLYHVDIKRKHHNLLAKGEVNFKVKSYMRVNILLD